VLLEQLQAIDPERRLGRYVGRVSAEQQQEIDHALTLVLGLF
jgi:mRNA-degrading endonuclease toxin of MazEF toxin-antitoxin module